jgi:hypothetical protein
MNRIITSLFFLLVFCGISLAQQIPNYSFETWSGGKPDNWSTSNQNIPLLGTITTVSKDLTDPQQGVASARLTAVKISVPFVGTYKIPGVLTLGKLNVDLADQKASVSGGYPFAGRPLKLSGYLKYQPVNNDTCILGLGLFKWNNGKQDTIGFGAIDTFGIINTWCHFEIPIHYLSEATSDTVNILFLNSNPVDGIDHTGTEMWVDNLSFSYGTVGIEGVTPAREIRIYAEPNAKCLILEFAFEKLENLDISLFTMSGSLTNHWKRNVLNSTERLYVNNLSPGTYVIRISSGKRLIDTRKITILN